MKKILLISLTALMCGVGGANALDEYAQARDNCKRLSRDKINSESTFSKALWNEDDKNCIQFDPCKSGDYKVLNNYCKLSNEKGNSQQRSLAEKFKNYNINSSSEVEGFGRYLCDEEEMTYNKFNTGVYTTDRGFGAGITYLCKNNTYQGLKIKHVCLECSNNQQIATMEKNGHTYQGAPQNFCTALGKEFVDLGNDVYQCNGLNSKECIRFGYFVNAINNNYKTEYIEKVCTISKK